MLVGLAIGGVVTAVKMMPERMSRILAFTDLEHYRNGDGLQQWLAQRALGTGGEWGVGIGHSIEKRAGGIPYANSDFIFPIIGEELGMWLSLAVIFCYILVCISGIVIAMHAPTRFGRLLAFGIATMISLQAILHIGVCLALLPNKGTALPFVSAGGTNLVMLLGCVGILANIYRQARHLAPEAEPILSSKGKLTPAL
jgi:cell division protein FtsW